MRAERWMGRQVLAEPFLRGDIDINLLFTARYELCQQSGERHAVTDASFHI